MTASEKLRALGTLASPAPWSRLGAPFWRRPRGRVVIADADVDLAVVLRNALPKIVAVVEAAEWTSESGVYSYERHQALTAALTALEEEL